MPPARPVAPLSRELATAATAFLGVGAGGLVAALALIDNPVRALMLFATSALVVGAAMSMRAGWILVAPAPAGPGDVRVETRRDTVQRHVVVALPAVIMVAVCLVLGVGLGALVAGVVAGTGAGDLAGLRLARRREAHDGGLLLRELGGHPFANPRRPLYIRSLRANTFST